MITCANCGFTNPRAFVGYKTELQFIRVINGISHDEHKRFYCGVNCYTEDTLKREFYRGGEVDKDISLFEEYKNENAARVKNEILAFPSIQDFLKRNNLEEEKPFNVDEEIKDWADC